MQDSDYGAQVELSKEELRKLDEEDKKLVEEVGGEEKYIELDDLLGFQLPKTKCFVPPVPCGDTMAPLMSLVPLYGTVILPIYSYYSRDIAGKFKKYQKFQYLRNSTV